MRYTNLAGETDEQRAAREVLRRAELELTDQREQVAELRRALPIGPRVEDYVFLEGPPTLSGADDEVREVRLSELFSAPGRSLIIYHLMFGKGQATPCPMCTMWLDGFNGVAPHLARRADLAVVAAADVGPLRAHARSRGWDNLRVLSAASSTFKLDLGSEDADGDQGAEISVFTRDLGGAVRHFYSATPSVSDERNERGIDGLCATWNLFDLTPEGRGDWYASLSYI